MGCCKRIIRKNNSSTPSSRENEEKLITRPKEIKSDFNKYFIDKLQTLREILPKVDYFNKKEVVITDMYSSFKFNRVDATQVESS